MYRKISDEQYERLKKRSDGYDRVCQKLAQAEKQIELLEKRYPDDAAARKRIAEELRGSKGEHHRGSAWIDAGAEYDEQRRDFIIPEEGWPDGVDPERYVAERLNLTRELYVPRPTADGAPSSAGSNPFGKAGGER